MKSLTTPKILVLAILVVSFIAREIISDPQIRTVIAVVGLVAMVTVVSIYKMVNTIWVVVLLTIGIILLALPYII